MALMELHVGEAHTYLRATKGKPGVRVSGPPEEAVAACLRAAGVRRRRAWLRPRVAMHLSTSLARPFVVGPVQGLSNWQEATTVAAAAAPAATGITGPCQVVLEDWPSAGPVLASAVAHARLHRLADAVRVAGCRLVSVRPAWALSLNRAIELAAGKPVLTVMEDDDGAVMLAAAHGPVQVAMSLHPRPSPAELENCIVRLALSYDGQGDEPVRWRWSGADFDGPGRGWQAIGDEREARS